MKIAIISDSHTKVALTNEAIEFLKEQDAQYLIHAGDLVTEDNLKLLKKSKLPYVCVFGNNDYNLLEVASDYNIHKEPYNFKIKDTSFTLMHMPYYMNSSSDVVLFGHTHIFEHEYKNKTLFLNPGEICAREKPLSECVLLEINENEYIINYYFKNVDSKKYEREEFRYVK